MPNRHKQIPNSDETAKDRFERTLERVKYFRDQGYEVVEKWECDLKKEMGRNPEMLEFFENLVLPQRLDPRTAFYGMFFRLDTAMITYILSYFLGGRTNAVKLYKKVGPNERMLYADIVSLYPYTL